MTIERALMMAGAPLQYRIPKSLRFRSSASAYLSRTPGTSSNQTTWTYSAWFKKGAKAFGTGNYPLFQAGSNGSNNCEIGFYGDSDGGYFSVWQYTGSYNFNLVTSATYRDYSAWYHVVVAFDSTQATAANRIKIYINGVQVTAFGTATYPSQNYAAFINNSSYGHAIGRVTGYTGGDWLDGYLAEVNFIDGQALTPSSFGAFDATSGVWQATKYSGTYGTNGFYLKFSDTTSTTTLCYDYSGNSNNWTPNNISLTAGSTYDSMLDSPTNYDNGGYGVGNYAVLNPLSVRYSGYISDGNLNVVTSGGNVYNPASSSIAVSSGKWYFEALAGGAAITLGIALSTVPMSSGSPGSLVNVTGTYAYLGNGWSSANGTYNSSYGASYASGDVIGVALDLTAGTLTFYKNGVSQGVASTGLSGSFVMFVEPYSTQNWVANFGQRPFAYTPPTGFKSLCTYNLPLGTVTTSGSFTGNASADGPFIWVNGVPTAMTINGNAVTFGTHADKTAGGFKLRTSSSSYNASGSNTYSITSNGGVFKKQIAQTNP